MKKYPETVEVFGFVLECVDDLGVVVAIDLGVLDDDWLRQGHVV